MISNLNGFFKLNVSNVFKIKIALIVHWTIYEETIQKLRTTLVMT